MKTYPKGNKWLISETPPRIVHKRNSSIILNYIQFRPSPIKKKDFK